MNSRTWLNLALVILVAASAALMFYLPGPDKPAPPPALTALTPGQITRIAIERNDQPTLTFVKEGPHWRMTAPLRMPANTFRVESLLDITRTPSHARLDAAAQDLTQFKLAAPRVRVRLNDLEIAFGDTDPLNQRRYVRIGPTLHLIDDSDYYNLIALPTVWVSNALLAPDSRLIALELPGRKLTRQADGSWQAAPPPASASSADAVPTLVNEWTHAQALEVKPYQAANAQAQVTLRLQGQPQPLRFEVLAYTPELILARPDLGVQYHLVAELAERLLIVRGEE